MILIKIIISLAIICITSYIGIETANNLKSREQILTEFITFMKMVENEIMYMANTLPNAFEISRHKLSTRLKYVIGAIVVDMTRYSADRIDMSIENNVNTLDVLNSYDKEIIISTLKNLGRGDLESQMNIIENSIQIIETQIIEANTNKNKNSKVYRTIGVITGLIIVVIFI